MTTTNQGWECPKCHAVMAPFCMQCVNCKGDNKQMTNVPINPLVYPPSSVPFFPYVYPWYTTTITSTSGGTF